MDSCIADVRKKNPKLSKTQAIKICHGSVVGGKSLDDTLKEFFETGGQATVPPPVLSIPAREREDDTGDRGGQQMDKPKKKTKPKNKTRKAKREEGRRRPPRAQRIETVVDQEALIKAIRQGDDTVLEIPVETETPEGEVEDIGEVEAEEKFFVDAPAVSIYVPFGGSETWDDLDDFLEARDFEQTTRQATYEFETMVGNVLRNPEHELSEKGGLVAALAEGLTERAEDLRDEKDILVEVGDSEDLPLTGDEPFKERVAAFLKQKPHKTVDGVRLVASDFASVGDASKPKTWKLPLVKRSGVPDAGRVAAAITAMQPGGFRGKRVQLTAPKQRVMSRIRGAISRLKVDDDAKARLRKRLAATKSNITSFAIFKDNKGRDRWFGWVTNRWRDRDEAADPEHGGEILTDASHKDFVEWVDKNPEKRMPQLWPWHTKELAHKHRADWLDYAHGFLMMSGPLEKDEAEAIEKVAEKWDLGMSHGFYPVDREKDGGLITKYRSFEVSYLPIEHTANQWTDFMTIMKEVSAMSEEKREVLRTLAPEGFVDEVFGNAEKTEALLDSADVETKEGGEAPAEEAVEAEAVAEETPAAEPEVEAETVEAESAAETESEATEEVVEKEASEVEALRTEVGEALDVIGGAVKNVTEMVEGIAEKIDSDEEAEAKAKAEEEEEIAELTPAASLVAQAKRAIGQEETAVEDDDELAKKGPEETEADTDLMMGVPILHDIKQQNLRYHEQQGRAPGRMFSISSD
jgi:hypothetical protein